MMQGDDIQKQRQIAERSSRDATSHANIIESHTNLALWVIAEQLFELRAIAASFQEALQTGFGEHNGFIRIHQEEK